MGHCHFNRMVKEGLNEKVMFEQRSEGSKGTIHADIWGMSNLEEQREKQMRRLLGRNS